MADSETALQPDLPSDESPNGQNNFSGPPAAEAGGILTVDLAALAANWRMLASKRDAVRMRRGGQGRRLRLRHRAGRAGAGARRLQDLLRRRSFRGPAPARCGARATRSTCSTACSPTRRRPLPNSSARPVIGSLVELAEWDGFCATQRLARRRGAACRHRHEPARPCARGGGGARAAHPRRKSRHHAVDEPSRLRRAGTSIRSTTSRSSCSARCACFTAASPPRSPIHPAFSWAGRRIATWCGRASALYGVNPTPGQATRCSRSSQLQARIVQARTVARGETVGYGATWTARRATRLAVVAVGYADGFPRALSASDTRPGAEAIIAGTRCPLAGRISMDLLAIDVTDLPDGAGRRGEMATLIGGELDIDERGRRRRHHRLRGAHQPRPALSPSLPGRLRQPAPRLGVRYKGSVNNVLVMFSWPP